MFSYLYKLMLKTKIMNDAHLHLVLNHLPIITPVIGLLIMIGGLVFSSEILKRTAYLVLILAVVVAILTFATGEGAEDVVEKLAGIDENLIKTPQEVADKPSVDRLFYALLFQK